MKKVLGLVVLVAGVLVVSACSSSETVKYKGVEVNEQDINNIERVETKITKLLSSLYEFDESDNYNDTDVRSDTVSLLDEFEKIDKKEDLYENIETLLISNENDYSILSCIGRASDEKRPLTSEESGYIFDAIDSYITGFSKLIVSNFDDYEEMEEIIKGDIGME